MTDLREWNENVKQDVELEQALSSRFRERSFNFSRPCGNMTILEREEHASGKNKRFSLRLIDSRLSTQVLFTQEKFIQRLGK